MWWMISFVCFGNYEGGTAPLFGNNKINNFGLFQLLKLKAPIVYTRLADQVETTITNTSLIKPHVIFYIFYHFLIFSCPTIHDIAVQSLHPLIPQDGGTIQLYTCWSQWALNHQPEGQRPVTRLSSYINGQQARCDSVNTPFVWVI